MDERAAARQAIADGRLHVSGVVMLAPHLTDENVDEVLVAASHRTKTELEELVARLAPQPDLPERMTRVSEAGDENHALQVDLDPPGRSLDPDLMDPHVFSSARTPKSARNCLDLRRSEPYRGGRNLLDLVSSQDETTKHKDREHSATPLGVGLVCAMQP